MTFRGEVGEGTACGSSSSWTGDEILDASEGCVEESSQAMGCLDKVSNQIGGEGTLWVCSGGTISFQDTAYSSSYTHEG